MGIENTISVAIIWYESFNWNEIIFPELKIIIGFQILYTHGVRDLKG